MIAAVILLREAALEVGKSVPEQRHAESPDLKVNPVHAVTLGSVLAREDILQQGATST